MPKSLVRGDYSLMMAIESASRPNSWYRLLADRQTGVLSCDCPPWTFAQQTDTSGQRTCPHTRFVSHLTQADPLLGQPAQELPQTPSAQALLEAVQEQWPGLHGQWEVEQKAARMNNKAYHLVLIRLHLGNGTGVATGIVAFAEQHAITRERILAGVAGWCGYALAAEVARIGGYPLAGQPPEHFSVRPSRRQRQVPPSAEGVAPGHLPPLGLVDILRIGDEARLADGLRPAQRAENTLRLFLGEELYQQVELQGFLDVSSVRYSNEEPT